MVSSSSWHLWPKACLPPGLLPTATAVGRLDSLAPCREGAQAAFTVDLNPSSVTCRLCRVEQVLYPPWVSVRSLSLHVFPEHLLWAAYTVGGGAGRETDLDGTLVSIAL